MRLFVAIDFNELREELAKAEENIPEDMAKLNKVGTFHLTLKFLGDVHDDDVSKIKAKLKKIEFNPFSLTLDKVGFFPNENFVRVVWVGVKPIKEVVELQKKIEDALLEFKFKRDFEFYPHITIARVKFVKDKENFVGALKGIIVKEKKIDVKDFRLVKSVLSPDGPVYEDIASFSSL